MERIETVVIGGGQAGLATSFHLSRNGQEHVVLEGARIAERWRSERWDSLTFQFPNATMSLPGFPYAGHDPQGFAHRDEVVRFIETYAGRIRAPLRCGAGVSSLGYAADGRRFRIATDGGEIECANVVVATGPYQRPSIPPLLEAAMSGTFQLHSSRYRNPDQLPVGATLIVGSGASGCQIADDLLRDGRHVYLAVGSHRRVPRRYRGRDFAFWEELSGEFDRPVERRPAERMSPLLTGVDGGEDVDIRKMARQGVVLLGHVAGGADGKLAFAPDLGASLRRGDEWFEAFLQTADRCAARDGLDVPADDVSREPGSDAKEVADPILELDMKAGGVTSVIWSSGFGLDLSWISLPVFGGAGARAAPLHRGGVTDLPGLYFVGLPWLSRRKSSLMSGVGEDARFIADTISRSGR